MENFNKIIDFLKIKFSAVISEALPISGYKAFEKSEVFQLVNFFYLLSFCFISSICNYIDCHFFDNCAFVYLSNLTSGIEFTP